MDLLLKLLLALGIVILVGCLVPLLLQLRRTARAVEALAESARADLGRIATDIHQARIQLDNLSGLAEKALEFPANASPLAAAMVRGLTGLFDTRPSPWLEALVTAVKIGIDFLRRPRGAAPTKEKTDA